MLNHSVNRAGSHWFIMLPGPGANQLPGKILHSYPCLSPSWNNFMHMSLVFKMCFHSNNTLRTWLYTLSNNYVGYTPSKSRKQCCWQHLEALILSVPLLADRQSRMKSLVLESKIFKIKVHFGIYFEEMYKFSHQNI